jgi:hypothetical protein
MARDPADRSRPDLSPDAIMTLSLHPFHPSSQGFIKRLSGSVAKPYEKANEEAMLKTMQDCLEETRQISPELEFELRIEGFLSI